MTDPKTTTSTSQKAVTLQDIADRCGLTKTTVSHALRENRKQVSARTIAFVRAVAEEMGYDPSRQFAARHLALQRFGQRPVSQTVAMFFPRGGNLTYIDDPYYSRLYQGIISELFCAGYAVLALEFKVGTKTQVASTPVFSSGYVDGAMALGIPDELSDFFRHLRRTVQVDFPIVTLIHEFPPYPAVVTDDRQGAMLAAEHLLALGHRHLLHFQPGNSEISDHRLAGYREAYATRGLSADAYLHYCPSWYEYDFARGNPLYTPRAALEEALACWPRITGILAGNDRWAGEILLALRALDIAVPEEMSLVGFDDTRVFPDAQGRNLLTTVAVPLEEIGRHGARRLLELIQQPKPAKLEAPACLVLPTQLIVRGSTAPPARGKC